jgi:hypothetical protein
MTGLGGRRGWNPPSPPVGEAPLRLRIDRGERRPALRGNQRVLRHTPLRAAAVTTLVTTLRVTGPPTDSAQAAKLALRRVARRRQQMSEVIKQANADLRMLVTEAVSRLVELIDVGIEVAARRVRRPVPVLDPRPGCQVHPRLRRGLRRRPVGAFSPALALAGSALAGVRGVDGLLVVRQPPVAAGAGIDPARRCGTRTAGPAPW